MGLFRHVADRDGAARRRAFLRDSALFTLSLTGAAFLPRQGRSVELLRDVLDCDFESAAELIRLARRRGVRVLDRRGRFLAAFGNYYAPPVPASRLPRHVVKALLVEEDRRFREHGGLDYRGIARGLYETVFGNRQGGSTLSQQVLKNTCFRDNADDRRLMSVVWRKVKEAVTVGDLEDILKKDGILDVYLNSVLFGGLRDGVQVYGIQAASRTYFDKYAETLTVLEGAILVQLLNAPNGLNPWVAPAKARAQAERLLDDMVRQDALRPAEAAAAKRAKVRVRSPEHGRPGFIPGDVRVGWFAGWARREAEALAPAGEGVTTVTSSLWPELQDIVQDELTKIFVRHGKASGFDQGAAVVMSLRGEVLAMIGGADYPRLQWNNAVQAKRQPGSAFKLFVYLAALERGLSPSDRLEDSPLTLRSGVIRNHDDTYRGRITLAEALAHSSNPVAVRLAMGRVPQVVAVARRLGIAGPLEEEVGLALGVSEVTLIELVAAYAAVANGGFLVTPGGIVGIRDNNDAAVHCRRFRPPPRVIEAPHAAAMRAMLAGVVRAGTGRNADPGFFAAGKTGTTDDFADAWFVGFTERFAAGVWLGNEKPTPMRGVSGGGLPAIAWRNVMRRAHKLPRLRDVACEAAGTERVAETP
jgi:penicillin-binding protein 1A